MPLVAVRIGSLNDEDARAALTKPAALERAVFDEEALDLALDITRGHPYLIQEMGYKCGRSQTTTASPALRTAAPG